MIIEITKENINEFCDNELINLNKVNEELNHNPFAKYIIFFENEIKGYIYYSNIYDRVEINQLEVKEKYRNQKIATLLLSHLIEKENKPISLEVKEDNIKAISLYKKFNFKQTAIRKNYYKKKDGLLMERILK